MNEYYQYPQENPMYFFPITPTSTSQDLPRKLQGDSYNVYFYCFLLFADPFDVTVTRRVFRRLDLNIFISEKETFRFRHRFGIKNTPSCFMTSRTRPSEACDTRIPLVGIPIVTQDVRKARSGRALHRTKLQRGPTHPGSGNPIGQSSARHFC